MTIEVRTSIASIIRSVEQGLMSEYDAYHAIAELIFQQHQHN